MTVNIYETAAFRLLAQGMKDRQAVGIVASLIQVQATAEMTVFDDFNDWAKSELGENVPSLLAPGMYSVQLVDKAEDCKSPSSATTYNRYEFQEVVTGKKLFYCCTRKHTNPDAVAIGEKQVKDLEAVFGKQLMKTGVAHVVLVERDGRTFNEIRRFLP